MIETQSAFRCYDLPADGPPAHQFLLDQIASAQSSLYLMMFGWTDTTLCDAIIAAAQRGVRFRALLDHVQSTGSAEVALLHRLWLQVPPCTCRITTSPERQYMHRKRLVIDGDVDVPDAQYTTLDDATAAHYPRVITGSTNWSPTAFRQTNDLLALPGKLFAAQCIDQFEELWAWADAHEQAYQPKSA